MVEAWKPLTFADEAGPDAARLADPLAPAKRSQAALAKVHTRQLPDGSPAMSCGRLLAHRGGIVRNTVRPKAAKPGEATFTLATTPNAKPDRALERLAMIAVKPRPDTPLRPQPVAAKAKSSSPPGELRVSASPCALPSVLPAKAGTQPGSDGSLPAPSRSKAHKLNDYSGLFIGALPHHDLGWVPAFAGMTSREAPAQADPTEGAAVVVEGVLSQRGWCFAQEDERGKCRRWNRLNLSLRVSRTPQIAGSTALRF